MGLFDVLKLSNTAKALGIGATEVAKEEKDACKEPSLFGLLTDVAILQTKKTYNDTVEGSSKLYKAVKEDMNTNTASWKDSLLNKLEEANKSLTAKKAELEAKEENK